jgi:hypothetical protein
MGRGVETEAFISEVTQVISSVMATTQMNNSSLVQSSSSYTQLSINSDACLNLIGVSSDLVYQTDTSMFNSQEVMQSVYTNILNQIVSTQTAENTGSLVANASAELIASVSNLIQSSITATTITAYSNDYIQSTSNLQMCVDSSGSKNIFYGTYDVLIQSLTDMYASMATEQGISATIGNYVSSDQTASATGLLAIIARAIALVAIVIIIVIAIALIIVGVILMKSVI